MDIVRAGDTRLLRRLKRTFTTKEINAIRFMFENYNGEGMLFGVLNTKPKGITNSIAHQALRILMITDVIKKVGHGRNGTAIGVFKPYIITKLIELEEELKEE